MKEGWTYKKLGDCVIKIPKTRHVKSKDYKSIGKYPIVSQEKEIVSGYWDDEEYLFKHSSPVIIFGDHTKEIKYIDFDFVVGADGTQILQPKDSIVPKFFYYALKNTPLRSLGYARHFKLLKEQYFYIPPLSEQQQIVDRLDSAFAKIDAVKANAEKALNEAKALFQASLKEMLEPKEGWEEKALGDVSVFSQGIQVDVNLQTEICSSGKVRFLRIIDVTRGNVPPRYIDDPGERYFLKADEIAMVRYGTVGFVCYGFEGVIANNLFKISIKDKSKLQSNFLQYFLKSDLFQSHIRKGVGGAALPAIKFGDIKHIMLAIPPLSEQQRIVSHLDTLSEKLKATEERQIKIIAECDAMKQALLREVFE